MDPYAFLNRSARLSRGRTPGIVTSVTVVVIVFLIVTKPNPFA